MFIVISYDIPDDKRRTKIHKVLKDFGQWVQYSVFECSLEAKDFLRLKQRLQKNIDSKEDSIRFYFLCQDCQQKVERIGGVRPLDENLIFV